MPDLLLKIFTHGFLKRDITPRIKKQGQDKNYMSAFFYDDVVVLLLNCCFTSTVIGWMFELFIDAQPQ